jgi:hypothetical protein
LKTWVAVAALGLAVELASANARAQAQSAPSSAGGSPVVVDVQAPLGHAQAEAVRTEIAREIGAPALPPMSRQQLPITAQSARGTLMIFVSIEGRLTVRWRSTSGAELERSVVAPGDPLELVRTIGVLAANLLQDPLAELPERALPVQPSEQTIVVTAERALALEPIVVRPTSVAPARWPALPMDWRSRRGRQRLSFGLDGYVAYRSGVEFVAPDGFRQWTAIYALGGLFLNYHARPWLRVGVNQVGGGGTDRGWSYMSLGPYAEFVFAPWQWLELYGQVGLGLQLQVGRPLFGLATNAQVTAGARFRIGHVFSLGLGGRGALTLSGDYAHNNPTVISAGDGTLGGGIELGWTIGG